MVVGEAAHAYDPAIIPTIPSNFVNKLFIIFPYKIERSLLYYYKAAIIHLL
jgi:hypothetical protein